MNRAPDPKWLGLATWLFDICLWLYPGALRRAHGEEMRQAFRDRCRELAAGQTSAWRLFGVELLPDLVSSLGRAHAEESRGGQDARVLPGLLMLGVLVVVLSTQPTWSGHVLDFTKSVEARWRQAAEAREDLRYAAASHALATALAARSGALGQAEAALVHRALYDQRQNWYARGVETSFSPEEGQRAALLAATVIGQSAELPALALAVQACVADAGCDVDRGLRSWLTRDPDNAFAWMLEFRRAAQLDDSARMAGALAGAARARRYESYTALMHRDLFAAASALSPGDGGLLEDAAWQAHLTQAMATDDFVHDLRLNCSLRELDKPHQPRWVDLHPEARASCLHLAGVLAGSTDIDAAEWGWRQLLHAKVAMTPQREAAMRDVAWWSAQSFSLWRKPDSRGYWEWNAQEWARWADSWKAGDGEIPAMRRWLRASGLPERAPSGFDPEQPGAWHGKSMR